MRQTSVVSLAEAGMMTTVAIVFALIGAYIPIIGLFISFIWPVPFILLGGRRGYKWSIMATVVASAVIAVLIHPLQAVYLTIGFGLIGIILGYAFQADFSTGKTLLWGSLTSFVSKVTIIAIGNAVIGINTFKLQADSLNREVKKVLNSCLGMGVLAQQLTQGSQTLHTFDLLQIILLVGMVVFSVCDTYLNVAISRVILRKLGHHNRPFN